MRRIRTSGAGGQGYEHLGPKKPRLLIGGAEEVSLPAAPTAETIESVVQTERPNQRFDLIREKAQAAPTKNW